MISGCDDPKFRIALRGVSGMDETCLEQYKRQQVL
jgi:hypothetical protein